MPDLKIDNGVTKFPTQNCCLKRILLLAFISINGFAAHGQKLIQLILSNPSTFRRDDELIILTREQIGKKAGKIGTTQKPWLKDSHGKPVNIQIDDENGDGVWDRLTLLQSFKAGEIKKFTLAFKDFIDQMDSKTRAHVRQCRKNPDDSFGPCLTTDSIPAGQEPTDFSRVSLPPFLTEGPAWENDQVGFRTYFDIRNTKDIWGKTTSDMVLDEVGVDHTKNYHKLAGWGMDILKVGKSLGAGSLALRILDSKGKDTLVRLGGLNMGKVIYEKISDGPLRAVFRLHYPNWKVLDGLKPLHVTEEISIWGGQYFYESKVTVEGAPDHAQLIVGFANFGSEESHLVDTLGSIILYSHALQSENGDKLGMAISMNRKDVIKTGRTPNHDTDVQNSYTVASVLRPKRAVYFRFYAGWEKSDRRFSSEDGFKNYLLDQVDRLRQPITVSMR